jgi:hypothetical protein
MPDTVAIDYLRSLLRQRELRTEDAIAELHTFFKRRDRRPPEEFQDSSFLYMRSFDADLGARPFANVPFWLSPDISLSPLTGGIAYTDTLKAGDTYVIRCALRNRGDIGVPSAKVELFLTDPTLGFDTRFATNLTLGHVPSAWVPADAHSAVEFAYTVPSTEAGHKCLFARAFSFSPLDLPIDDFQLDPRLDRHVAQRNLNIVGQSQPFEFAMVHAPNARVRIRLRPLEPEQLLKLHEPALSDVAPAREIPRSGWGRTTGLGLSKPGGGEIVVREEADGLAVEARDPEGLDLGAQRELNAAVRDVLRKVAAGTARMADYRDVFAKFRRMNSQARRSTFRMALPDLGLAPRQAVGLDITAVDENDADPQVFGGITVVVIGT